MSNGIYSELEEPSNFHRLVYETIGTYDLSAWTDLLFTTPVVWN